MRVETCTETMLDEWLAMRMLLWPLEDAGQATDGLRILRNPDAVTFLARDADGRTIGFAEATLRRDYVNGCETSPVGFLEGLFVREEGRRRGAARALCRAVEAWALDRGVRELASDTWLDSIESQRMHRALGFAETERVVYFRKELDQPASLAIKASDNS
jgi:aminoglycoside 6'-N-acetyltransferase I